MKKTKNWRSRIEKDFKSITIHQPEANFNLNNLLRARRYKTFWRHDLLHDDNQPNDTQLNDTQHNDI